jgi:3-oxoacyl-[acyl-carrier protein] reductase
MANNLVAVGAQPAILYAREEVAVCGALNLVAVLRPHFVTKHFGRVITTGSNLVHITVVPYHD